MVFECLDLKTLHIYPLNYDAVKSYKQYLANLSTVIHFLETITLSKYVNHSFAHSGHRHFPLKYNNLTLMKEKIYNCS